jgi:putative sterol carrier protein
MSEAVAAAVTTLNERLDGGGIEGTVRIVIEDEGSLIVDGAGARPGDGDADCTLTASADTFRDMLEGALDPTSAFMGGRLAIDGDMGAAMRLAGLLS